MAIENTIGLAYCPSFGINGYNISVVILSFPLILFSIYCIYAFASSLLTAYQSMTMNKTFKYGNIIIVTLFQISSVFCLISMMNCTFAEDTENIKLIKSVDEQSSRSLLFSLTFLGFGIYSSDLMFLYQFWKIFFGTNYTYTPLIFNSILILVIFAMIMLFITVIVWFSTDSDGSESPTMLALSIINIVALFLLKLIVLVFLYFRSLVKIKMHQINIDNASLLASDTYNSYLKRSAAESELTLVEREKTLLKVGTRYATLYSIIFVCNVIYLLFEMILYINIDNHDNIDDNNEFLYYLNAYILIFCNFICIVSIWFQFDFTINYFEKYCIKCFNLCVSLETRFSKIFADKQADNMEKMILKRKNTSDYQFAKQKSQDYMENIDENYDNQNNATTTTTSNKNKKSDNNTNNNNNSNNSNNNGSQQSGLNTPDHASANSNEKNEKRKSGLKKFLTKKKSSKNDIGSSNSDNESNNNSNNNNNKARSSNNNSGNEDSSDAPQLGRDLSVSESFDIVVPRGRSSAMSTQVLDIPDE